MRIPTGYTLLDKETKKNLSNIYTTSFPKAKLEFQKNNFKGSYVIFDYQTRECIPVTL